MKKFMFIFTLMVSAMSASLAQTEISGYLDATPADGISGAAATFTSLGTAAAACRNLVHDGKTDWYIPSVEEITLFLDARDNDNLSFGVAPSCTGSNCNWADQKVYLRSYTYPGTSVVSSDYYDPRYVGFYRNLYTDASIFVRCVR